MWEEQSMGSQTLEILRQGVWASITGGWYFDPGITVFSNTFHLYLWLFLLCLPFSFYIYLPSNKLIWITYCFLIGIVISVIKFSNYFLHYIYDTKNSITEVKEPDGSVKRIEEEIELKNLSSKDEVNKDSSSEKQIEQTQEQTDSYRVDTKPSGITTTTGTDAYGSNRLCQSDSVESVVEDFDMMDIGCCFKEIENDKESDDSSWIEIEDQIPTTNQRRQKKERQKDKQQIFHHHHHRKPPQFKEDEDLNYYEIKSHFNKDHHHSDIKDSHELDMNQLPSLQSVDSATAEQAAAAIATAADTTDVGDGERRHSNFTNGSLNLLSTVAQTEIKPTGSLELGYIDKNPNQSLDSDGFYFNAIKNNDRVRRFRSTALETCCPPPDIAANTNSLEVIGCKKNKNHLLPLPSISLTRNQYANISPYYGESEIVYPIAEQSDEHQTSHGPDTDIECMSDSDLDETNQASYSNEKQQQTSFVQEIAESSSSSSSSGDRNGAAARLRCGSILKDTKICSTSSLSPRNLGKLSDNSSKLSHSSDDQIILSQLHRDEQKRTSNGDSNSLDRPKIIRKRNVKRHKRSSRDIQDSPTSVVAKPNESLQQQDSSSLVELGLDMLYENEEEYITSGVHKLPHRREPLKSDSKWSSSTTVSLEQDVSKVLEEVVRSLGAIPKKVQIHHHHHHEIPPPRSESQKCQNCSRCRTQDKLSKENKITQTTKLKKTPESSLEDFDVESDCGKIDGNLIFRNRPPKFKHQIELKPEETSSSGSNNELSTLITPGQPLLAAILPPISKGVFDLNSGSISPKNFQRNRLQRSRAIKRRNNTPYPQSEVSDGFDEKRIRMNNKLVMVAPSIWTNELTYKQAKEAAERQRNRSLNNRNQDMSAIPSIEFEQHSYRRNRAELFGRWSPAIDGSEEQQQEQQQQQPPSLSSISNTIEKQHSSSITAAAAAVAASNAIELAVNTDSTSQGSSIIDNGESSTCRNETSVDGAAGRGVDGPSNTNRSRHVKFIKMPPPIDGPQAKVKNYYRIKLLPWKLTMDRLGLLSLLDRNITLAETILTVCLSVIVSIFGAFLLYLNFYRDFFGFIFCFIIASSQYSLCKSVQPDAASPTHGFNRIIAYSRPVYFCIFAALLLIIHYNITDEKTQENLLFARNFLCQFILFFPLLFSIGLFPQINTFTMYCMEQIDIHVFGGNAMCNLISSFYCVCRSILTAIILTGLAYGGLSEEKASQHILFSIYCACLMAISYHLSRSASDPSHIWNLIRTYLWMSNLQGDHKTVRNNGEKNIKNEQKEEQTGNENLNEDLNTESASSSSTNDEHIDPLPKKLQVTINNRLKNDLIVGTLIAIVTFALHSSTIFMVLHSELCPILWSTATGIGLILHYLMPQARKQLPWMIINKPILPSNEARQYQIRGPAKIMCFEKLYIYLGFLEKNVIYPLMALTVLTEESPKVTKKYGMFFGSVMVVISSLKFLRTTYSDQNFQYLIITFTVLLSKFDYQHFNETFLISYFFISILFHKVYEFTLKIKFIITYIAPWQITWGSAFHAFAQPFSVPHSAMLFIQAGISALFSTPLSPFLGSAIFFTSYVRPVKFWERDYNTRRVDHSNTPLSSHLDRNLGADDNNLNSIFYEHLTRSLQHSLSGDLAMGRWGIVSQGDIFVMASDYLNCLIHIIEIGNGLVTFQMRGLEFRGTYCQQREVEAITEGVEDNYRLCCCEVGHIPNILSLNTAFHLRWMAWEVTAMKYIVEGYSISDNSVVSVLQVFEFRKVLVTYYVKSIIFYTIRSPKLESWLNSEIIIKTLKQMWRADFVELDPIFNFHIDEDYDNRSNGMTKAMFVHVYGNWIQHCLEKRGKNIRKQGVITLCFALSLLGRRALGAASQNMASNVEFFLYGLHALFKGDFRVTCARDEWVFFDMDLLKSVLAPAVRMSLKLHQDHFMSPDEYEELPNLYDAICKYDEELVLSHEGDPTWRNAILCAKPSLMALRHVCDEGADEYKIIMLNKRHLGFRVIKINKECVRGLWAGQQQELVYLRNRNPERGSIQNARQSLRNIINSSCDQPIGYPIYVSPLTTSYSETNEQYRSLVGGSVTLKKIQSFVVNLFRRVRKRCGEGCSSGASNREELSMGHDGLYATTPINFPPAPRRSTDSFRSVSSLGRGSSLSRTSLGGNRGSFISVGKPASSTLASLTGLFKEKDEKVTVAPAAASAALASSPHQSTTNASPSSQTTNSKISSHSERKMMEKEAHDSSVENECIVSRVKILDPNLVYDCINLGRRIDVGWPTEYMRCRGGRSYWKDWVPEAGMEGPIVHKWTPFHRDPNKRSHVDRTILLIQIDDKYVPIAESGVQDLGSEV